MELLKDLHVHRAVRDAALAAPEAWSRKRTWCNLGADDVQAVRTAIVLAQAIVDGWGQYPSIDHNRSKTVGGLISVLAVNRGFMDKNREAVQRLVVAYLDVLKVAQADPARWARIYAEKAGLPEAVAAESIRITRLDATLPLQSITRISKFLSDNGVIARDVSGEIAQHYTFDFLARATGKAPAELGLNQ